MGGGGTREIKWMGGEGGETKKRELEFGGGEIFWDSLLHLINMFLTDGDKRLLYFLQIKKLQITKKPSIL